MEKSTFLENLQNHVSKQTKPFVDSLEKESDRALGIIAACLLDQLLEKLISTSYVKDPQVKDLFKNDHILQSFFAKINIAYFSGLIPEALYHDLKLMCGIRNEFAHAVTANLDFNDKRIADRIGQCLLRPKTLDDIFAPKIKFIIITSIISAILGLLELMLSRKRPPNLVELLRLNEIPFDEIVLTKEEILEVVRKERAKIAPKE